MALYSRSFGFREINISTGEGGNNTPLISIKRKVIRMIIPYYYQGCSNDDGKNDFKRREFRSIKHVSTKGSDFFSPFGKVAPPTPSFIQSGKDKRKRTTYHWYPIDISNKGRFAFSQIKSLKILITRWNIKKMRHSLMKVSCKIFKLEIQVAELDYRQVFILNVFL
ncbi:hypothetical protein ACTA71_005401 [Dictyostelium dimigraforme]